MDEEFKHNDHIDELRRRLYARNAAALTPERHTLGSEEVPVAHDWASPIGNDSISSRVDETLAVQEVSNTIHPPKKHGYRSLILLGSLFIFVLAAALSSAYLYFGGNQISSDNIDLAIAGPNSIGGGEKMSLQLSLTNQNPVGLESVTLIIKYPSGARTAEEPVENLFEQRIWLDTIAAGEAKNIPIQFAMYGEEGDEKEIQATLEYRLSDSNGTFYKDAEPLKFRVVTSPIVLQLKSVNKVASGQEVEVKIDVKSNSPTQFKNLLVSASYPTGFNYKSSDPEPAFGQNVWRIDELNPGETKTISLKGKISGLSEESIRLNVSAGPADPSNQFVVSTNIAESYTEFLIERPFLDVGIMVNGERQEEIVLSANQSANIGVEITNTLEESVYDMVVEAIPSGNAFKDDLITTQRGFYDSNTGTIKWESSNIPEFLQVKPGASQIMSFSISPGPLQSTAAFDLTVNVYGRRVAEPNAQEQLVGTISTKVKYSSSVKLGGQANVVSGPVPPKVGTETIYAVALLAEAGVNDVTNAVVKTSLPVYVTWENDYSTDGLVEYNDVTHELTWQVGNIDSGKQKELVFKVSILPSSSQVGIKPVLVNNQYLVANDRFTNATLETDSKLITTELPEETGYGKNNGVVSAY
jgi:hypothetical protein